MNDKQALILLNMTSGPALSTVRKILDSFPAPADIFKADRHRLLAVGRMSPGTVSKILEAPAKFNPEEEEKRAEQLGVRILTFLDPEYPAQLKEIYDFPPVLYVRGNIDALSVPMLAVVGSRQPTFYGTQACQSLCSKITARGIGIVSGMARGIDKTAHESALESGAVTVAVLGCGIDILYPSEHKELAEEIINGGGALISEFPLSTRPYAYNFPRRNRVISGLSIGVLVAEAAARSGSLITATCAIDQNRTVFAVPGKIDSIHSDGTNALIKSGAKLIMNIGDILEEIPQDYIKPLQEALKPETPGTASPIDNSAMKIYENIQSQPVHLDFIADIMADDCQHLLTGLLELEMKGMIKSLPGRFYVRTQTRNIKT